jgi:hypothetical protein
MTNDRHPAGSIASRGIGPNGWQRGATAGASDAAWYNGPQEAPRDPNNDKRFVPRTHKKRFELLLDNQPA